MGGWSARGTEAAVDYVWEPVPLSNFVTLVLEDWDCPGLGRLCKFPILCPVGFHVLPPPPAPADPDGSISRGSARSLHSAA